MAEPSDLEARVAALEARVDAVAADATAARHLAAVRDRDVVGLGLKVDANRSVINALGEQTGARFDRLEEKFDQLDHRFDRLEQKADTGFVEMRGKLDQAAAGQQQIAQLLTTLIDQEGGE